MHDSRGTAEFYTALSQRCGQDSIGTDLVREHSLWLLLKIPLRTQSGGEYRRQRWRRASYAQTSLHRGWQRRGCAEWIRARAENLGTPKPIAAAQNWEKWCGKLRSHLDLVVIYPVDRTSQSLAVNNVREIRYTYIPGNGG